jgi:hypothetical protein
MSFARSRTPSIKDIFSSYREETESAPGRSSPEFVAASARVASYPEGVSRDGCDEEHTDIVQYPSPRKSGWFGSKALLREGDASNSHGDNDQMLFDMPVHDAKNAIVPVPPATSQVVALTPLPIDECMDFGVAWRPDEAMSLTGSSQVAEFMNDSDDDWEPITARASTPVHNCNGSGLVRTTL